MLLSIKFPKNNKKIPGVKVMCDFVNLNHKIFCLIELRIIHKNLQMQSCRKVENILKIYQKSEQL